MSTFCHVFSGGGWGCLCSDVWWNNLKSHTPSLEYVFTTQWTIPLYTDWACRRTYKWNTSFQKKMVSCIRDLTVYSINHATFTVSSGCPTTIPTAPTITKKQMLFIHVYNHQLLTSVRKTSLTRNAPSYELQKRHDFACTTSRPEETSVIEV